MKEPSGRVPGTPRPPRADADGGRERAPRVLLAGNPNSGKTTVFNLLTGSSGRVGNYPGVTVERHEGRALLPRRGRVDVVDLPGTYSLTARSPEEQIAVDALVGQHGEEAPDVVVVVLDATTLERGLYLAQQVAEVGRPLVLALNVTDLLEADGQRVDAERLAERFGAAVVPMVASRQIGKDALLEAIAGALTSSADPAARAEHETRWAPEAVAAVAAVEDATRTAMPELEAAARRAYARWALLSLERDDDLYAPAAVRDAVARVHAEADASLGPGKLDLALVEARYARIDDVVRDVLRSLGTGSRRPPIGDRLDQLLTHRVWGLVVFAAVMAVVFQALFSWSEPMMGWVEAGVGAAQGAVLSTMPQGTLRDLLVEGVIGGVGNVVVFVPQIALLFLFIGFLEDSGYLARVAFVIDRVMGGVGLHGRAFVPMLSGFACAVPAVMATRTLESRRDRLLTMLVVPLTSCSARLPVYVLLTAAVFGASARIGFVSVGAVVLFSMYTLSVIGALVAATVLRRTVLRGPRPTLVLELPSYRLPVWSDLLRSTWQRVKSFLVDAGTIILAMTILLWALLSYPVDPERMEAFDRAEATAAATLEGEALDARLAALDAERASAQLRHSFAGRLGRTIEPAIEPLGFDWRLGVGIVGAFAAREVFVSTLGVVFGIEGEADETSATLRSELREARWPDGRRLLTPLVGVSLMVFFVFAAQCMSTLAVIKRESGSWRWPAFVFVYMTALAYGASLLVYQGGKLLGWT